MAGLERTLRVLDALGLFIVTRFPFIELFTLLMSTGEKAERMPGARIFTFRDTLRREYVLVYANAAVFFVCGTGMTLDFKRRKCGFAAALHAVVYTVIALFQHKSPSEYLIVSKANVYMYNQVKYCQKHITWYCKLSIQTCVTI